MFLSISKKIGDLTFGITLVKGGRSPTYGSLVSVYIHILVSQPGDDQSSGLKLAVIYKNVNKVCVGCD